VPALSPRDVEAAIGDRFLLQSSAHAQCLAVGDGSIRLTYAELERRARTIAADLQGHGVHPGERVVLLLDQGAAAVAAVLGVLLAGAVYVPLDASEPTARIDALLERIEPTVIVADGSAGTRSPRQTRGVPVIASTATRPEPSRGLPTVDPRSPAAIHFTSGSTGAPKGVVDSHRNIVHNAMRYTVALGIEAEDRLSLIQAPASSATMSSLFAALLNGAALFPYRLDAASLPSMTAWLRSERITIYHSVPSILRKALLVGGPVPDVRVVRLEGDRAYNQDMALWRRHVRPGTRIANGLGTTETGLCRQLIVSVDEEPEDGIMPVGYAVPDMELEIVADDGSALPVGAAGEIAVTSEFLALGYWQDEELTGRVFEPAAGRPNLRTYRTGDLGCLRPDGCVEYLGRRDGLAKVLGHRVEPAEVEAALATIPGVAAAAVRIVDAHDGGVIVAFVVAQPGLDEHGLRAAAADRLPPHMRPARYVRLGELPVGANGKIDRAALREPVVSTAEAEAAPGEGLEGRVTGAMSVVLGRDVGMEDDFFALGGDSLAAVDLLVALEREVGHRLPPSLVLGAPTASLLTKELRLLGATHGSRLLALSEGGIGRPIVFVPSHHGHALPYALLARLLEGVRPVYALEQGDMGRVPDGEAGFISVASRYAAALRAARFDVPYTLAGFCFGGAMAYEITRQLADTDDRPAGLCLLGVSPYDFPALVPTGSLDRWMRSMTPGGKARRAVRLAAGLASAEGRAYVGDRIRRRSRTVRELSNPAGRARYRRRRRRDASMIPMRGRYLGDALDVPVTLVLPSWSLASYCDDPVEMWRGLGPNVAIHTVPGVERMMLSHPVVGRIAAVLSGTFP
jgi:amino acid adenylation domain-containing protein